MPKVSVITISYNNEKTIENNIQSVKNQTSKDFEYILVDGNSKDKTLEIAGRYKDFIKKWISEPDKGIYDAMNKGILLAQGEYIIFLNANDVFASNDILEKIIPQLDEYDIVYGNIDFVNVKKQKHGIKKQKRINKTVLYEGAMHLQSEFIKRDLLEQLGGFDLKYTMIASDEFNIRAIIENNATAKHVAKIITTSNKVEKSLFTIQEQLKYQKEKKQLMKTYFSTVEIMLYKILSKLKK